MFEFIAQLIIILSIGGILVIIIRKISEFKNMSIEDIQSLSSDIKKPGKISQKIKKINYQNVIQSVVIKLEKLLRKLRIIALKFDNWFEQWIKILKNKEQEFKTKTHFSKIQSKIQQTREKSLEKEEKAKKNNKFIIIKEKKYIKAIIKNPRDVKTYWNLGLLYLGKKNYRDAKASFKQILKIDSKNKEAKEKLEEIKKK